MFGFLQVEDLESHTNEVQWLLHMNNQRPVIHQEEHKCTDIFILKNTTKKTLKRLQHLFTTCPFFVFVHCTASTQVKINISALE